MGTQQINLKPINSCSINGESPNSQELREDAEAALVLCSWKHLVLNSEEALKLEDFKRRILSKHGIQYPFPDSRHCRLPPMPALEGVVGNCSTPFEKQLTESDLKKDQIRLLLQCDSVKQYLYPLLSPDDLNEIKESGILVNVYDYKGKIYEMVFRLWGERAHVLTSKNWLKFCSDHNLVKIRDWVTIWMFKHTHTDKICFVITSERKCLPVIPEMASAIAIPERKRKCPPTTSAPERKRRCLPATASMASAITIPGKKRECLLATASMASVFAIPAAARKERTKKRRRMDCAE